MPVVAEILALLAAGALTGLLSGLLGIGGGVVIVPVLLELFAAQALPEPLRLPLATGTAHAAVLLTSVSAALAHGRAGRVDGRLVRAWLPPLLLGAAGGLVLARVAAPALLAGLFAGVTLGLALALLAGDRARLAAAPPTGWPGGLPPLLVGVLAAALGVGAGTLSGPTLALLGAPLPGVVGAGAAFNLAVALPSVTAFIAAGWAEPGLPRASLGHVALVPLALLVAPALAVTPWAAGMAARLPVPALRRIFALCLLVVAARMAARALT